jgi:trehalose utilization protein
MSIHVTVFNEFIHERKNEMVRQLYPDGIHKTLAAHLRQEAEFVVQTATLDQAEHGLTDEVLAQTDVLIWWGHIAHDRVKDAIVDRVQQRVLQGMGLIVLHSAHYSKIFKRLLGTSCGLVWREADEKERLWVVDPTHPITQGLGRFIEIPAAEMYGEFFDIPQPDQLIFISWFEGGEVFRSGATWRRGQGRIFYFRPGHETYPIFHQKEVLQVLTNAVRWACFRGNRAVTGIGEAPRIDQPLEPIRG